MAQGSTSICTKVERRHMRGYDTFWYAVIEVRTRTSPNDGSAQQEERLLALFLDANEAYKYMGWYLERKT